MRIKPSGTVRPDLAPHRVHGRARLDRESHSTARISSASLAPPTARVEITRAPTTPGATTVQHRHGAQAGARIEGSKRSARTASSIAHLRDDHDGARHPRLRRQSGDRRKTRHEQLRYGDDRRNLRRRRATGHPEQCPRGCRSGPEATQDISSRGSSRMTGERRLPAEAKTSRGHSQRKGAPTTGRR